MMEKINVNVIFYTIICDGHNEIGIHNRYITAKILITKRKIKNARNYFDNVFIECIKYVFEILL